MRGGLTLLLCPLLACGGGRDAADATRGPGPATLPASFELGRSPSADEVAAWDLDVNPAGEGLPPGGASARDGASVYATKCAVCHGVSGEGVGPNPPIVGREPRDSFPFARSLGYVKTVGNYWPYATTIYDYLRRAMPQDRPGSLTPNELYGLTAWILAANGIIADDSVMHARSLPTVQMPARNRFVPDDRPASTAFR